MNDFKKKLLKEYKSAFQGELLNRSETSERKNHLLDWIMHELYAEDVKKKAKGNIEKDFKKHKELTGLIPPAHGKEAFYKHNYHESYFIL